MVRRVLSLLLTIMLLGMSGQSAAYAARGPDPVESEHMAMPDCMKMMEPPAPDKATGPGKHKDCTPADCLNYMIACAGIAAAIPDTSAPKFAAYDRRVTYLAGLVTPLRGRSPPPDLQPPIA